MEPSEVRARVLAEHAELREMLANVGLMVEQLDQGRLPDSDDLFGLAKKIRELLEEHMATEERWLVPSLLQTDWGEIRANRILEEHATQRIALERLEGFEEERNARKLGRELMAISALLIEEMQQEETECLGAEVLGDASLIRTQ